MIQAKSCGMVLLTLLSSTVHYPIFSFTLVYFLMHCAKQGRLPCKWSHSSDAIITDVVVFSIALFIVIVCTTPLCVIYPLIRQTDLVNDLRTGEDVSL